MNEIEIHPFKAFIPANASSIIIGSFPGIEQVANRHNPEEWFYGTADNLFWKILSESFETELKTRIQKENFLATRGIAVTDIFTKIRRKERKNLDRFLTEMEYNKKISSIIEESGINKIFFTSKYVEKHFHKAFPQIAFGVSLPSPSPAANIPISMSEDYKNYKQLNPNANTQMFRVFKYKQLLS